ncbi:MAG: tyrosine-type recombinase/integrase [Cellulosilyticaceae bacterium]
MIEIREVKEGNRKKYIRYEDGKQTAVIDIKRIIKRYRDFDYMILLDSRGQVIKDAYYYLNYIRRNTKRNTREVELNALKLLYVFMEMFDKSIKNLETSDVYKLMSFIEGGKVGGNNFTMNITTQRKDGTFNDIMGVIKRYLKTLGYPQESLDEVTSYMVKQESEGFLGYEKTTKQKLAYRKSLKKIEYCPEHITSKNYLEMIEVIEKKMEREDTKLKKENTYVKCMRDLLIIKLMYSHGLRIGAVLGLTTEDVKENPFDEEIGILVLRNRRTDHSWSCAKGNGHYQEEKGYRAWEYETKGDYQEVAISKELKTEIEEYLYLSQKNFRLSKERRKNIKKLCIADSIDSTKTNYYIFTNKDGKRLQQTGWNKVMRELLSEIGISVDKGCRRTNLNHKLRHGTALFGKEMGLENEQIQEVLMHANAKTTRIYSKLPKEEASKLRIQVEKNILERLHNERNSK